MGLDQDIIIAHGDFGKIAIPFRKYYELQDHLTELITGIAYEHHGELILLQKHIKTLKHLKGSKHHKKSLKLALKLIKMIEKLAAHQKIRRPVYVTYSAV